MFSFLLSLFPSDKKENNLDNKYPVFTFLQITSSTFFFPAILAFLLGYKLGSVIYFSNGIISIYVHRGRRIKKNNIIDYIDHINVFVWIIYNSYLYYNGIKNINYMDNRLYLSYSTVCVIIVFLTKLWTKLLIWRSLNRYIIHSIMHLSGSLGSLFLLKIYTY